MRTSNHNDVQQARQIETIWTILDTLLQTGKEQVASSAFRLLMAYIFLDKFEKTQVSTPYTSKLLQAVQDTRIEQSWGSIMMAYRCEQFELSRKCFEYAIEKYSHYISEANRKRDCKPIPT